MSITICNLSYYPTPTDPSSITIKIHTDNRLVQHERLSLLSKPYRTHACTVMRVTEPTTDFVIVHGEILVQDT